MFGFVIILRTDEGLESLTFPPGHAHAQRNGIRRKNDSSTFKLTARTGQKIHPATHWELDFQSGLVSPTHFPGVPFHGSRTSEILHPGLRRCGRTDVEVRHGAISIRGQRPISRWPFHQSRLSNWTVRLEQEVETGFESSPVGGSPIDHTGRGLSNHILGVWTRCKVVELGPAVYIYIFRRCGLEHSVCEIKGGCRE